MLNTEVIKCENYFVVCHVLNKGWHLLMSKSEQLCMRNSLHHVPCTACNEPDTYSIVLSFTLCAWAEGLHFTDLYTQNKSLRVTAQEQK